MSARDFIQTALVAWGLPALLVGIARFATPDPDGKPADFPSAVLATPHITTSKHGRRLKISEAGQQFHFQKPDRDTIMELSGRIPEQTALRVIYYPTIEGNVLLDVRAMEGAGVPYLDFNTTMGEYAKRRRLVYVVAGIWFVLWSPLFAVRIDRPRPQPCKTRRWCRERCG